MDVESPRPFDSVHEKLTMLKLAAQEFPAPESLVDGTSVHHGEFQGENGLALASFGHSHSERHFRRSTHRSSSIISSTRRRVTSESITRAESHFLTLVEFISNASREASTLKDFWTTITTERDVITNERDELLERVTELIELTETHKHEHRQHEREMAEKQRTIEKLMASLATAAATELTEKKRYAEAEEEIKKLRREHHESDHRYTQLKSERQSLAAEVEMIQVKLRAVEEERDSARRHHHEHDHRHRGIVREKEELSSRLEEMTVNYEASQREVSSLQQRLSTSESERLSYMHRCDKMSIEEKKMRLQLEEYSNEILLITDKYERCEREMHRHHDTIISIEKERTELHVTIEQLRRDLKLVIAGREKVEEQLSDYTLRYEHLSRECITLKESITTLEEERISMTEKIESLRSQHRTIVIERNELSDKLHDVNCKLEESHRRISTLDEEVVKSKTSISQLRSERTSLIERAERAEHRAEEHEHHHSHTEVEFTEFKRRITTLELELQTMTEARDALHLELSEMRSSCEEFEHTSVDLREHVTLLEFDIESLRASLREACEQRERAIASRNTSDQERDEYITKYEEKCRQLERMQEDSSSHGHHHHHNHHPAYERVFGSLRNSLNVNGRPASVSSRSRVMSPVPAENGIDG